MSHDYQKGSIVLFGNFEDEDSLFHFEDEDCLSKCRNSFANFGNVNKSRNMILSFA